MVDPAVCGLGVIFLLKGSVYGVLIGTLIVSAGEFVILVIKYSNTKERHGGNHHE